MTPGTGSNSLPLPLWRTRNNNSNNSSNNTSTCGVCTGSFRQRERCLILLALTSLSLLCIGAYLYLPDLKTSSVGVVNTVYREMQRAGPDLLMPAPPLHRDIAVPVDVLPRPRPRNSDNDVLQAKIDRHYKLLERPPSQVPVQVHHIPVPVPVHQDETLLEPPVEQDNAEPDQVEQVEDVGNVENVMIVEAGRGTQPLVTGGEDSDPLARERREQIKQMMKHAWDNYKLYAWGKNELKPISKRGHTTSIFGASNLGATIIDGLDTLYIMGLDEDFKEGRDWIADNLVLDNVTGDLSVFETTIRFIGGMLTCYAFTGDVMFRDKAKHVADKLLPAFQTATGIPHSLVNPSTGISKNYPWASGGSSILSEIGTLHLEFSYLSDITGNPVYREKVDRVRKVLRDADKPRGLYPNYINPKTGKWGQHHISLGGLGDSFYEYLLKAWLLNKEDFEARQMYDDAMKAIIDNMIRVSHSGLTYVADMKYDRIAEDKMDHLSCFSGGLFALGAKTLKTSLSDKYMDLAQGLTNTCHESYQRSPTKLGPEAFRFGDAVEAKALKNNDKYYILRPETIESYFILWRLTKDPKYREWGWEAAQAIEKHCRVEGGYTGIRNVYLLDSPKDDVQQSFFLAETLKYLYLLFSDDSLISLDQWVFNTEAHPLPERSNPFYRAAVSSAGAPVASAPDTRH